MEAGLVMALDMEEGKVKACHEQEVTFSFVF